MSRKEDLAELRGVGKILDALHTNSYYWGGRETSKRIIIELEYYFGKNWTTDMYKIICDGEKPHCKNPVKTLKELSKNNQL